MDAERGAAAAGRVEVELDARPSGAGGRGASPSRRARDPRTSPCSRGRADRRSRDRTGDVTGPRAARPATLGINVPGTAVRRQPPWEADMPPQRARGAPPRRRGSDPPDPGSLAGRPSPGGRGGGGQRRPLSRSSSLTSVASAPVETPVVAEAPGLGAPGSRPPSYGDVVRVGPRPHRSPDTPLFARGPPPSYSETLLFDPPAYAVTIPDPPAYEPTVIGPHPPRPRDWISSPSVVQPSLLGPFSQCLPRMTCPDCRYPEDRPMVLVGFLWGGLLLLVGLVFLILLPVLRESVVFP